MTAGKSQGSSLGHAFLPLALGVGKVPQLELGEGRQGKSDVKLPPKIVIRVVEESGCVYVILFYYFFFCLSLPGQS